MKHSIRERFYNACIPITETGCWVWLKGRTQHGIGYGTILYKNKPLAAHRLSYELHKGIIPEELFVLHTCDNTYCVNPDHLFLGTQKNNLQDASRKRRLGKQLAMDKALPEMWAKYVNGTSMQQLYKEYPEFGRRLIQKVINPLRDKRIATLVRN